jgi:hypothetical protein
MGTYPYSIFSFEAYSDADVHCPFVWDQSVFWPAHSIHSGRFFLRPLVRETLAAAAAAASLHSFEGDDQYHASSYPHRRMPSVANSHPKDHEGALSSVRMTHRHPQATIVAYSKDTHALLVSHCLHRFDTYSLYGAGSVVEGS